MEKEELFFILNVGSTSTKVAIFEGTKELLNHTISYSHQELSCYCDINSQLEMRQKSVLEVIQRSRFSLSSFSVIVSRGGSTKPLKFGGAYEVNERMVADLRDHPASSHAGNLGPMIALNLAHACGKKAYIYDSVAVDELSEIARISGLKEMERVSLVHVLNSRYVARKAVSERKLSYEKSNVIVAHMGGGITITMHSQGKIVDIVGDDEGTFSPERCGGLPSRQLVELCYSGKYPTKEEMHKAMRGNGGFMSYLGTNSVKEVEKMVNSGDKDAKLIYDAMIYQIAKGIAQLSVVTEGKVDLILLTGGIAHSQMAMETLKNRVAFLAPVVVVPGENEMKALNEGVRRALHEEETIHVYS